MRYFEETNRHDTPKAYGFCNVDSVIMCFCCRGGVSKRGLILPIIRFIPHHLSQSCTGRSGFRSHSGSSIFKFQQLPAWADMHRCDFPVWCVCSGHLEGKRTTRCKASGKTMGGREPQQNSSRDVWECKATNAGCARRRDSKKLKVTGAPMK